MTLAQQAAQQARTCHNFGRGVEQAALPHTRRAFEPGELNRDGKTEAAAGFNADKGHVLDEIHHDGMHVEVAHDALHGGCAGERNAVPVQRVTKIHRGKARRTRCRWPD